MARIRKLPAIGLLALTLVGCAEDDHSTAVPDTSTSLADASTSLADASTSLADALIPTAPTLASLSLEYLEEYADSTPTNPLLPEFDPDTFEYTIDVGLWLAEVQVIATSANADASITINGSAVAAGAVSPSIPLGLGETSIPIVVTAPGSVPTEYTLTVNRASEALQQAYAKASNTGGNDNFGYAVSLWGDTLAVGAWQEDSKGINYPDDDTMTNSGAVYIFTRTNTGWSPQDYLKASNPDIGDTFGYSVSLWGNILAVGAPQEDSKGIGYKNDNSVTNSGAVYVFTRAGTEWSEQAYLKASNPVQNTYFGDAVSLWDDTLAVSAKDGDSGTVSVFTWTDTGWLEQDSLTTAYANDSFGIAISLWGNTLAVGAPAEVDSKGQDCGAVHIFALNDEGEWVTVDDLKASNIGPSDRFGTSVSLWGDTLAVGANLEDSGGVDASGGDDTAPNSGAVYIFTWTGTEWSEQDYLKASNIGQDDRFGTAVSLWGDTVAVGAYREDEDSDASNSGAVYVFTRTGTEWLEHDHFKASNPGKDDYFGYAVSLWGDTLAVGANLEDGADTGVGINETLANVDGKANSGAAYLFRYLFQ